VRGRERDSIPRARKSSNAELAPRVLGRAGFIRGGEGGHAGHSRGREMAEAAVFSRSLSLIPASLSLSLSLRFY